MDEKHRKDLNRFHELVSSMHNFIRLQKKAEFEKFEANKSKDKEILHKRINDDLKKYQELQRQSIKAKSAPTYNNHHLMISR